MEIVFADGVVWCGNEAPERLSKQRLEEKLSGELVLQYKRGLGATATYAPFEHKDVWCCTCGNYNHNSNSTCLRCKREKDKQFYFFDEDVLIEKKRLLDEETAKLEAKRQEEKQAMIKKTKKLAKIVLPMVCAIVVLIVLFSNVIIPKEMYNKAIKLMEAKKYEEAYQTFVLLGDYKDSEALTVKCRVGTFKTVEIGDYIYFGSYEQDNDTTNGKEDIEWLVLEKKEGKKFEKYSNRLLIVSKYALDCQPYNEEYENVTWETCTLREWLNDEFVNEAFSKKEQKYIPTVTVPAHKNPKYDTEPGNATNDKVFLLSAVEAEKYFNSDSERQCMTTNYADANGAYVDSNGYSYWLLRSPGNYSNRCCKVDGDGYVSSHNRVSTSDDGVRPALWINLPS